MVHGPQAIIARIVMCFMLGLIHFSAEFPGAKLTNLRFYDHFLPWNTATVKLDELPTLCEPRR
jgi:hypothetical protein